MVDLDEETIDVLKKLKDIIADTNFDINNFHVSESGIGATIITIDIRQNIED